jgi:hypothetical protein
MSILPRQWLQIACRVLGMRVSLKEKANVRVCKPQAPLDKVRVGKFTCEMSFDGRQLKVEWSPKVRATF